MSSYEFLVLNKFGNVLGVFDDFANALIFIRGYYDTYFNEQIEITIKRQEKN